MNDNVIPFPGQNELSGMKSSQMVAKNVAKGKKVTQKQAFGALMEMRQMVDGVIGAVGRLGQSQVGFENILTRIDTNLGVLMSMLIDQGTFTQEDWTVAWKKYVLDPQEEGLTKHIEEMKKGSAEDAFFAEIANMVRTHNWPDREVEEGDKKKKVPGKQVKDFYIQMVLNPATRRQALVDIRKDIPNVPELNLEELEKTDETEATEDRKMPDCKYCGQPECEYCSALSLEDQIVETVKEVIDETVVIDLAKVRARKEAREEEEAVEVEPGTGNSHTFRPAQKEAERNRIANEAGTEVA